MSFWGKIEGPVWYIIYHELPVVKGGLLNPSVNQPANGKRTSMMGKLKMKHQRDQRSERTRAFWQGWLKPHTITVWCARAVSRQLWVFETGKSTIQRPTSNHSWNAGILMAWNLIYIRMYYWLVVGPPLWKIWVRQLGWLATQYMGK